MRQKRLSLHDPTMASAAGPQADVLNVRFVSGADLKTGSLRTSAMGRFRSKASPPETDVGYQAGKRPLLISARGGKRTKGASMQGARFLKRFS